MPRKTIFDMDFEEIQGSKQELFLRPVTTYVTTSTSSGTTKDDGTKSDD